VSPQWTDQVCVTLAPASVACTVWSRGWSPQLRARAVLPCTPDDQAPPWRPAVEALRTWLAQHGPRRASVRIVLSNHFLRYLVVPWQAELSGRTERRVLAQHLFQEAYGERAAGWHVQLGSSAYGRPALACAVDRDFHDALVAALAATACRLSALQPLLMLAFNQFVHRLGNDACLFVSEPGRLCSAVFKAGQWHSVQTVRMSPGADIDRLVGRQISVLGIGADVPVFVFDAAASAVASAPQRDGQTFQSLCVASERRVDPAFALLAEAQ